MSLEQQIKDKSQEISTDAYAMSVGELISLYKENELEIHPEFQRYFRWNDFQKTKFIESLLLGIPIPSIFVSQTEKGSWDVVDGLQRISTILQLVGILKDHEDEIVPKLVLKGTKYLPQLKNCVWENPLAEQVELPEMAKLKIKRARLDIKIVLNTSDLKSKYELFQRLNTGGSIATDQEVRNCLLIMMNKDFFDWLTNLRKNPNFQTCVPLSDRQRDEQYDMELVVRFIVLRTADPAEVKKSNELGLYLTDKIVEVAESKVFDRDLIERSFNKTFAILANTLEDDCFRKYDLVKNRFSGPFSISMFEIVALGMGFNCIDDSYNIDNEALRNKIISIWNNPSFINASGSGMRHSQRMPITLPLGRETFKL